MSTDVDDRERGEKWRKCWWWWRWVGVEIIFHRAFGHQPNSRRRRHSCLPYKRGEKSHFVLFAKWDSYNANHRSFSDILRTNVKEATRKWIKVNVLNVNEEQKATTSEAEDVLVRPRWCSLFSSNQSPMSKVTHKEQRTNAKKGRVRTQMKVRGFSILMTFRPKRISKSRERLVSWNTFRYANGKTEYTPTRAMEKVIRSLNVNVWQLS